MMAIQRYVQWMGHGRLPGRVAFVIQKSNLPRKRRLRVAKGIADLTRVKR